MIFEKPPLIIDNGSYNIKAGFSCDNHPISIFRNVVGRPSYLKGAYGRTPYEVYVGDNAIECEEDIAMNYPVVKGKIVNWDNMERVWHHIFYRTLKCAPEDRDILITNNSLSPMQEKLKTAEVFFEALNVPSLCMQAQSVLAMYGSGVTTGICVDLGHDTTEVTPVYEGGAVKYAYMQTGVGGAQVSDVVVQYINNYGRLADNDIESIKRDICYVTPDVSCDVIRKNYQKHVTLANGKRVDVSHAAFMAGELIFQPKLITDRADLMSLQDCLLTSAKKCDPDIRAEMYEAIILCGGLAMMTGLAARLATYLEEEVGTNLITSNEANCVAWLGAAVFANLPDVTQIWVSKRQYEEYGAKIIRNKFV